MSRIRFLLAIASAGGLLLMACGAESNNAQSQDRDIIACQLLPADAVAQLLGHNIASSQQTMDMNNGAYGYSMCSYTAEGPGKRLDIAIRRSGKPIEQSRQQDADKWRAEDDGTGMSVEFAKAVENGKDLDGFGAVAYTFVTDDSTHVVAYWNKRFQVHVTMSHAGIGRERTLQALTATAHAIIDRLKA